jgi:hypothetical protein
MFGDVEITGQQKMLKLVSLRLETQTDTTLHGRESCRQHGSRIADRRKWREPGRQAPDVSVAKYTVHL